MSTEQHSPRDLTSLLNSNKAMLKDLHKFLDDMLANSKGEEDTIALCSLRQHEQLPALSGLKRMKAQCSSELAYHDKLSSGEVPLDPFVKSTNAAHLNTLFRFLRLFKPDHIYNENDRVLSGILQAIHFKNGNNDNQGNVKPSWSTDDFTDPDPDFDHCNYSRDGEDDLQDFDSAGEGGMFGDPEQDNEKPPLVVDIQAFNSHIWLKAIARNPRSLQRAAKGEGDFGEKTMLAYANDYNEASRIRPIHHRNPFVIFYFEYGLNVSSTNSSPEKESQNEFEEYPLIAEQLLSAGILPAVKSCDNKTLKWRSIKEAAKQVKICSFCRLSLDDVFEKLLESAGASPLLPKDVLDMDLDSATEWLRSRFGERIVSPPSIAPEYGIPLQSVDIKNGVNLDVSTLLVLVSNLTNGKCSDKLFASNRHRALREQAGNELNRPVLKGQLRPFFAKRPNLILYCCETALKSFNDIVKILAGPSEKARADALRKRLVILPDVVTSRVMALPESVNVKTRAKIIFGCGDAYRLVTTTANAAFIRAALFYSGGYLGHHLGIYLHPSRALSEQKEEVENPEKMSPTDAEKWLNELLGTNTSKSIQSK